MLLILTTSALAAEYPSFENDEYLAKEYAQCTDASFVPIEFFSHNHDKYEFGKCFDNYYNTLNRKKVTSLDWANVVACANKNDDRETLMMLYANGFGVKKNINSAILHTCFVGGAPAEIKARLAHLNALKNPKKQTSKVKIFDICDDITSGMMMGTCAYYDEKQKDIKRTAELSKLTSNWPADQKVSFSKLAKLQREFANSHSEKEIDLSGSGRVAFQLWEQSSELDNFLINFKNFEAKKFPDYSHNEYLNFDKKLNEHFKAIISLLELKKDYPLVQSNKADFISTQKLWLTYRDEYIKFGLLRYPNIKPYMWNAKITKHRLEQLKEFRELLTD